MFDCSLKLVGMVLFGDIVMCVGGLVCDELVNMFEDVLLLCCC